jgi:hypothetical protein
MFSREQQALIDMSPESDETLTINGRVVARDSRGWVISADASCQNVRRCFDLASALAAVQPEKSRRSAATFQAEPTCACGWQLQAQRDFELAASWKQIAEEYRVDLEVERSRARRSAAAGLAS